MLHEIGFIPKRIKARYDNNKNSISLIDPACGSGTFLYSAVSEVVKAFGNFSQEESKQIENIIVNNIFGLDIAEFPLYLAEMSMLMRLLPLIMAEEYNNPLDKKIKVFLTKDSIAEFMDTPLKNTILDREVRAGQLSWDFGELSPGYESYVREENDLKEMKVSLGKHLRIPRRRFDFVIGNPPYVGYNECSKQNVLTFEWIKEGRVRLNNIYGINLHSIPGNRKKRPPKPNIYAFFIALGIALLKDNGQLCYIIPQTILINPDFDTIRYHMAKFLTIEKIITFSGKMFIGRGIKQARPIPTSSLIFVAKKAKPLATHKIDVINHTNPSDNIESMLSNILEGKGINTKTIVQSELLRNINNWNFIKLDKGFLALQQQYTSTSDSMSIYYDHSVAEHRFRSKFFFDEGYDIDESILEKHDGDYGYPVLNEQYWTIKEFKGRWPNIRGGKDKYSIGLLKANQRYNLLDSKYKIIWSYNNTTKFFFTDKPIIWARNKILGIGSHNKREILYLFALLNSRITRLLLKRSIKIEQEETRTILVSLQIIKEQIHVPSINQRNDFIKNEIIDKTEEMLELESVSLSDLVDFSRVLVQRFDDVRVVGNKLVLIHDNSEIELHIKRESKLIADRLADGFGESKITLSELRSRPMIDIESQVKLKDYIDDLVFALYFNINLRRVGLERAKRIHATCLKSKFYRLLHKEA
jgi:methylase of polypeptide subunit release factors